MSVTTRPRALQPKVLSGFDRGSPQWGIPHILLFLYLLSKPIYLYSSGLPQVADGFLLLLIGHTAFSRHRKRTASPWSHPLTILTAVFAYWSTLVNLVAAIGVGQVSPFVISSAMNIYNAAVVATLFVLIVDHEKSIIRSMYYGALASVGLQVLIMASGIVSGGVRASGTFNNPNQLAFHGLLVLSIVILSHHLISPPVWLTMTGVGVAVVCVTASFSRSGLLATAVVLLGATLWPPGRQTDRRKFRALYALSFVGIVFVATATDLIQSSQWFRTAYARATKTEPAGFETNRGYDRITDFPQYWIFGAGDGAYSRFGPHEFHSTFGNVQLSYGVVGLALYVCILWLALRGSGFRFAYVILGTVTYGLAHNGLRSSIAWMLLVMLLFVARDGFGPLPAPKRRSGSRRSELLVSQLNSRDALRQSARHPIEGEQSARGLKGSA